MIVETESKPGWFRVAEVRIDDDRKVKVMLGEDSVRIVWTNGERETKVAMTLEASVALLDAMLRVMVVRGGEA